MQYQSQLAFIKPQVEKDILVSAQADRAIELGQSTKLIVTSPGPPPAFNFTPAEGAVKPSGPISCSNGSGSPSKIGVGFLTAQGPQVSILYEEAQFGSDQILDAEFTPVLRGYVISGTKENQVFRTVVHSPKLFDENLVKITDGTYNITKDGNGKYHIDRE